MFILISLCINLHLVVNTTSTSPLHKVDIVLRNSTSPQGRLTSNNGNSFAPYLKAIDNGDYHNVFRPYVWRVELSVGRVLDVSINKVLHVARLHSLNLPETTQLPHSEILTH